SSPASSRLAVNDARARTIRGHASSKSRSNSRSRSKSLGVGRMATLCRSRPTAEVNAVLGSAELDDLAPLDVAAGRDEGSQLAGERLVVGLDDVVAGDDL